VALPALGVLATLLHAVPVVGLAAGFVPPVMSWVVLVTAAIALLAFGTWLRGPSRALLAVVVVAALTVAAGAYVIARQVTVVENAGADVDLVETLDVWSTQTEAPDAEETYTSFEGEPLRLGVFRPRPGSGPAPVLLFVHGGGWVAGDRNAHATDLRWFADRGWLAVSVDYALSSPERHLWDVVTGQIGCAMTWVTRNAARFGGDPARLSLSGDSAGGNLAINAAYMASASTLQPSCAGEVPAVGAVSALYPAVDPAGVFTNDDAALGGTARGFATSYLGGSPSDVPDRYAAVASAGHVTPAAPPTLLLLGAADHLVPTRGAYEFADRAAAAGVSVKLVSVPYADHVFDEREGSVGQQAYRQLTAAWLREHGQGP
jgi:acetyl esterase/lipase